MADKTRGVASALDAPRRPVHEADTHVAEVVLRELTGQPLEAHHRPRRLGPQGGDERVERTLPALVPVQPTSPQNLEREQLRLVPVVSFEVVLRSGRTVRVPGGFGAAALARLVNVLEEVRS